MVIRVDNLHLHRMSSQFCTPLAVVTYDAVHGRPSPIPHGFKHWLVSV